MSPVDPRSPRPGAPPHAPELGFLGRLLGPLKVTGVFWFKLHAFGARRVPDWAKGPVIQVAAWVAWALLWRIPAAIGNNLEVALGPCGFWQRQRRIVSTLRQFAWCMTERYERLEGASFEVDQLRPEGWDQVLAQPDGWIFLTAHIGSWEVGSAVPTDRDGLAVHVVREEEMDPKAQAYMAGMIRERMGAGYHTHFASGADPRLGITLLEALRRGEIVALQGDRPRVGGKIVEGNLFGRPYLFPAGPMALARSAGAPVLPVFVLRLGRRHYQVITGDPIEVPRSKDRQADLEAAVARAAAAMEEVIGQYPHQWFCLRDLWPDIG
ncbi:MAG: lysophospholipid acyltransferase family protein [Acidobacteriota bacterium]